LDSDLFEAFIGHLRERGRAASTVTNYLQFVKAIDKWMAKKGYQSTRVLTGDSFILRSTEGRTAALETGCPRGELLGLRSNHVDLVRGELSIAARPTRARKPRVIPISPDLRALLEFLQNDSTGKERPGHHFVFDNPIGEAVVFAKKAWEITARRAHGTSTTCVTSSALGSWRLLAAAPCSVLFHADLEQTSTYLNVTRTGVLDSMKRFGTTPWQTVANSPPKRNP
jgi:integrase